MGLAAAFQQHWREAIRRLFAERDQDLVDEVERLLRAHDLEEAERLLKPSGSASELPRRFADLLAEMDPELEPIYDSVLLSRAGLEMAAMDVVRSGGSSPVAGVLDEVRRQNVLTRWRRLPGMGHGPVTQDAWVQANNQFEGAAAALKANGFAPRPNFPPVKTRWCR